MGKSNRILPSPLGVGKLLFVFDKYLTKKYQNWSRQIFLFFVKIRIDFFLG